MILPEGGNLSADQLRRIEYFAETYCQQHERLYRYGWGHLLFACYAAFPAHLTPDLLHKLRLNFRHYTQAMDRAEIHPVAVSDLLLSNLVRETGFERYEMPEDIRQYLLWLLQHSGFFQEKDVSPIQSFEIQPGVKPAITRINHLAAFLLRYTSEYYTASDPVTRSLREAQEWTAQAWLDPAQAARRLREKLSSETATPNERYHFSRLGKRLAAQYALHLNPTASAAPDSFHVLHTYAKGITSLYSGKSSDARQYFGELRQNLRATEGTAVASGAGTMRLPVPVEVVKELLVDNPALTEAPRPDVPERPVEPKPLRWENRENRLRSAYPKAVLTISNGDIHDILHALTRMETELREQLGGNTDFCLGDCYDVMVGSGVGAFMAAMLSIRRKVADIASDIRQKEGAYLREGTQMMGDDGYAELIYDRFDGKMLDDPMFLSGLVLAMTYENGSGYELMHNLPDTGSSSPVPVEPYLRRAIARPSASSSLSLECTSILMETRDKLHWPTLADDFFWVAVDTEQEKPLSPEPNPAQQMQKNAPAPPPVLSVEQQLQGDMRWLERHTMELFGQHRFRYHDWDCYDKKTNKLVWPQGWHAPPKPLEEPSSGTAPPESPNYIYVVTADSLNVRSGPDASHPRIGSLKKGDQLELLHTAGDWTQVHLLNPTEKSELEGGWVNRQFIKLLSEQQAESKPKVEHQKATKKAERPTRPSSDTASSAAGWEQIEPLIGRGQTKDALAILVRYDGDAILLQAQFNQGKKEFDNGLIEFSEWQRIQARVNYSALEMTRTIQKVFSSAKAGASAPGASTVKILVWYSEVDLGGYELLMKHFQVLPATFITLKDASGDLDVLSWLRKTLDQCQIVLPLLSPAFYDKATNPALPMLQEITQRNNPKKGLLMMPVLLKAVPLDRLMAELPTLRPLDRQPIMGSGKEDKYAVEILHALSKHVEDLPDSYA